MHPGCKDREMPKISILDEPELIAWNNRWFKPTNWQIFSVFRAVLWDREEGRCWQHRDMKLGRRISEGTGGDTGSFNGIRLSTRRTLSQAVFPNGLQPLNHRWHR